METDIQSLGDEWAPRKDTVEVIETFIKPNISLASIVIEIGVGGGKMRYKIKILLNN